MNANDSRGFKRVVVTPSAYFPSVGGIEEISRTLSLELSLRGFDVVVVTNRSSGALARDEILDRLRVRRFEFEYPSRSLQVFRQLALGSKSFVEYIGFLRELRPDIVHVMGLGPSGFYTALARSFVDFKLLVTTHGEITQDPAQLFEQSAFARMAVRFVLSRADAVSACSGYVLDQAGRRFTLPERRSVIYNGVELDSFATEDVSLPFTRDARFVLAVGRLVKNKEFDLLIRAFAQICANFTDLYLVLAGDGAEMEALRELAASLHIERRVHFTGTLRPAQVAALYAGCDLFVSPCSIEGFGIVCLEAMRAGKPVVAADTGGPPEFIADQENGLLFNSGSVDDLSKKMQLLLQDPSLRQRMGGRSLELVRAFDRRSVVERYLEFYGGG